MAFRASDDARTELAQLLAQPVLKKAFDAIREKGVPKSIPQIDNRNHPDTVIAHKFHEMVGINYALDLFERMTFPLNEHPDDQTDAEQEPYAHSLPAHLREMPKFPYPPKQ